MGVETPDLITRMKYMTRKDVAYYGRCNFGGVLTSSYHRRQRCAFTEIYRGRRTSYHPNYRTWISNGLEKSPELRKTESSVSSLGN